MKTILITGGAGFIGSHTCISLLEGGYKIVIIDSFINSSQKSLKKVSVICKLSKKEFINRIKIYKFDIRDKESLINVFEKSKLEDSQIIGVIHLAGLKSVRDSIDNPLEYWDTNVKGAINLLSVMNIYNCFHIVFSSSATVYGSKHLNKIKEEAKICPINPYGCTKAAVESILKDLSSIEQSKWKIAILRYFNPIGSHVSGLIGDDPNGMPNNIFPIINKVSNKKLKILKIFGDNWPTKDGTGIRDYLHIMDLAEGHKLALDYLFKNTEKLLILNLGTGQGTSVLELLESFQKVNGVEIPYYFVPRREGDVASLVADNSKAKDLLNWEPKRTIEDMCRDGWKWINS